MFGPARQAFSNPEPGIQGKEKIKGCDIGYALATRSREEADRVDACTVTAS
jgi:hypothetical protein